MKNNNARKTSRNSTRTNNSNNSNNSNNFNNNNNNNNNNSFAGLILLFIFISGAVYFGLNYYEQYKKEQKQDKRDHILSCARMYQRNGCEKGYPNDPVLANQCIASFKCDVYDDNKIQCSFSLSGGFASTDLVYDEIDDKLIEKQYSITVFNMQETKKYAMSGTYSCK